MKTISIIIATFNASKTIERCINSIIPQKTEEIELVVIDGCSKDNTIEIIQDKYQSYIDILISEPDKGIYDAWNKGVKVCTGKWIMFLGADDIYKDDILPYYLNFLSRGTYDQYDLITGKCELVDENGKVVRVYGNPYSWDEFRRYMKISHGSTMHNRKLFDELGPFDISIKISADYEFLLRKQMKSFHIDKIVLQMQFGGMSNTPKAYVDTFKVRKKRQSVGLFLNAYYFVKGLAGFFLRKIWWKITK